jgi:hypothetical protein
MKAIIFIIVFSLNVNAQVIGFTFGGVGIKTDQHYHNFPIPIPMTSFSLLAGVETAPKLFIEIRGGYQLLLYSYIGWDLAGYLIYDIIKPLYITGSITFHDNTGVEEEGTLANSIMLIGIGAGVHIAQNFSIESDYSFPLKKEPWIYSQNINDNFLYQHLTGVLKVHFKFHWTL